MTAQEAIVKAYEKIVNEGIDYASVQFDEGRVMAEGRPVETGSVIAIIPDITIVVRFGIV